MNLKTLEDLFLDELADTYDAEQQLVKALPRLAQAATCDDLKAVIQTHLKETAGHVKKAETGLPIFWGKSHRPDVRGDQWVAGGER